MSVQTRGALWVAGQKPTEAEWNLDLNKLFTLQSGNIDKDNVKTSGATGLVTIATAQSITARKTFSGGIIADEFLSIAAAGAGDIKVSEFRWDPASGTVTDADGMYISWNADDDGGVGVAEVEYGRQHLEFVDVSAGSEDSSWVFSTIVAGSLTTSLTLTGTALVAPGSITGAGVLSIDDTTDTSSGTTGSIHTDGGLGVAKALWVDTTATIGGVTSITDATEATTTTAASLKTAGGIAWVKDAYVGDDMFFTSGAVLNFNAGDVTVTHSSNSLAIGGGDLYVANGNGMVIGATAQQSFSELTSEAQILGTTATDSSLSIGRWVETAHSPIVNFYKSGHSTIGDLGIITTGDPLGVIRAYGDDGVDGNTRSSEIIFKTEGTIDTGRVPGVIILATGTDAAPTVVTEAMRLNSSQEAIFAGNVGIGTTDPASLTEIQGGLTTTGAVLTLGTKETTVVTNDVLGRVDFYAPLEASGTDAILVAGSIVAVAEATFAVDANTTSLQFQTGVSGVATTKMTIASNGHIGIGEAPNTRLVSGTGSFDNAYAMQLTNTHATTARGLYIDLSGITGDNTYDGIRLDDVSGNVFTVWSDGDVINTDNSYGAISDVSLKDNIEDTGSQTTRISNLKIRDYHMKKKIEGMTEEEIAKEAKDRGVIADEIEKDFPELVSEVNWNGETKKAVNYMGFVPILLKEVKDLRAEVEALKDAA